MPLLAPLLAPFWLASAACFFWRARLSMTSAKLRTCCLLRLKTSVPSAAFFVAQPWPASFSRVTPVPACTRASTTSTCRRRLSHPMPRCAAGRRAFVERRRRRSNA
jgi:hypothetical protein